MNLRIPFRRCRWIVIALLAEVLIAGPAAASMERLWNALAYLEDHLRGAEPEIDKARLGTAIHSANAAIWDCMTLEEGSAIKRLASKGQPKNHTFLGKKGEHVFGVGEVAERPYVVYVDRNGERVPEVRTGPGPRLEIWIEKTLGDDGWVRADRVIIDHEAKTITISDLTTWDPNDPALATMPENVRQQAFVHEEWNKVRVATLSRDLERAGIAGYVVRAETEPGAYYESSLRKIRAAQTDETARYRRRVSDDGPGGGATKGLLGSILTGALINAMLPGPADAAEAEQSRAENRFSSMVEAYVKGDAAKGDYIRKQLEGVDQDHLAAVAQSFFPMLEDQQTAVGAYRKYIDPWLDDLARQARSTERRLDAAREAVQDLAAETAKRDQEMRQRVYELHDQLMAAYSELYREISVVHERLRSLESVWPNRAWQDREMEALTSLLGRREGLEAEISVFREELARLTQSVEPATVRQNIPPALESLARAYATHWRDLLVPAVLLAQEGIRAEQEDAKSGLRQEYEALAATLDPTDTRAAETLRTRFVVREYEVDDPYYRRILETYERFASRTAELSTRIARLAPSLAGVVTEMTGIDQQDTDISRLEVHLFADLDVIVYRNVPAWSRTYTSDALLTLTARGALETALGRTVPESGEISLRGLWVDGVEASLERLDESLPQNAPLTLWAEVADGPLPAGGDWPAGPPPVGGIRSRDIAWLLEGTEPGKQFGHVFRTQIPATEVSYPYTITLRAARFGVSSVLKRVVVVPPDVAATTESPEAGGGLDDLIAPAAPVGDPREDEPAGGSEAERDGGSAGDPGDPLEDEF